MIFGTEITRIQIRCRDYHYKGTDWLLAYAPECEQFIAINYKYLDRPDTYALKLTQPPDGVQMHLSPDMRSLITSVNNKVDLDELLAEDLTKRKLFANSQALIINRNTKHSFHNSKTGSGPVCRVSPPGTDETGEKGPIMLHYYYWRMKFRETGEILEGSRLYSDDRRANTYLYDYLYKHHARIREDEAACVELTVNRDDGTLLYSIIGDVYGQGGICHEEDAR